MLTRTNIHVPVEQVRALVATVEPLFERDRLFVTSRPDAKDPLHDGRGWLPDGVSEADYSVLNEPFRGTVIEAILQQLPYRYGRVRLMRLPPKTCYSFHQDTTTRLHYAITTNPACYLVERKEDAGILYHVPADGFLYRMDTRLPHNAMNCSAEPRIHLVITNLDETGPKGAKVTEHAVRPIPIESE